MRLVDRFGQDLEGHLPFEAQVVGAIHQGQDGRLAEPITARAARIACTE
jgi:hypothetical protein